MKVGKIYSYNGVFGEIITGEGKVYLFSYTSLESGITKGDMVSFDVVDEKEKIASSVKLINTKDLKTLIREYNNILEEKKE